MANFAITGVAGFVAPRHLKAINDTGNRVVAALDPHDAVGILDRYAPNAHFFTESARFERHLERLRTGPEADRVHYVTVCSPNYLHDAHIRLALHSGAHAICEKPLVLNSRNLDLLEDVESRTGLRLSTVLQLRLHPELLALRDSVAGENRRHKVTVTYITRRGPWYLVSWKGSEERSGGLVTNIGIHLFDLMLWIFGPLQRSFLHHRSLTRAAGFLELARADVSWFLSIDAGDSPSAGGDGRARYIDMDSRRVDMSGGFNELHTAVYREILAGRGCAISDARPSIELVQSLRTAPLVRGGVIHALAPPA